jgi:hypothetical protein
MAKIMAPYGKFLTDLTVTRLNNKALIVKVLKGL